MKASSVVLCVGLCFGAVVDPELPSPAPVVNGVFPHGAQRGGTTTVRLSGQNLHEAQAISFSGKGVRAKIVSSLGSSVQLEVTVDAEAEAGLHDFRLQTARGVYLGVFDIGALPEIVEAEDNDNWRKPQPITLPVLVNGIIRSEDWDHFRFHARAGQTLVFDVSATRHGSRLDADLAILDDKGTELAWVDDTTIFGDPHLEHTFEKDSDYVVRVGSLAGNANADYRLSVGELPYVSRTFPAGLRRGSASTVELTGAHMDLVNEVWLGDRLVRGRIVSREPRRLQAEFQVSDSVPVGTYRIHACHGSAEIAIPTVIRVGALPEMTVRNPGLTLASATPVGPSVVNGVLMERGKSHFYRFDARTGDRWVFRAESMKLGYHMDPVLTVLDADGNKLAYADDPGMDDRSDEYQLDPDLSFTAPKDGIWYVAIRDGMYRGGDQLLYRLILSRTTPDFAVELREPFKSMYAGGDDSLQVRIRRRAGWDTPVEVWAEGLPDGVTADHQIAPPKDSVVKDTCGVDRVVDGTIVTIPLHAAGARPGHFGFRVKARGVATGTTVEHEASVWYPHLGAGYIYGPVAGQSAELTVASAPTVLLSAGESWSLRPDSKQETKLTVRRFGEARRAPLKIRPRQLPMGVTVDAIELLPDAREARILVVTGSNATSGIAILEALNRDGTLAGETAPFAIEVKPEPAVARLPGPERKR